MPYNKYLLGALFGIFLPTIVLAAMSSTDYYIYADSLDFGGGGATSTDYNLQGSIGGEVAPGISTSTSYQVNAGYQAMVRGGLTLSLNSNSVDFGSLAAGTVVSRSVVATVDTDSGTGYTLSVSNVSGTSLSAVADGAVDGAGGQEEYGLAVTGPHANYATDQAIVNNLTLAYFTSPAAMDNTTLVFKAVSNASSAASTYTQSLVLTAAANP